MRIWLPFLVGGLVGCTTQTGAVEARAASDFGCDEWKIEVEDVGGNAYRAKGCGRSATYVCVGGGGYGSPTCIKESSGDPLPQE